ncbi:acyl-CoA N-acyltransferase [Whalleya microplaca]|nr:acyl-CoA N-acyltransferase [Whalleya microplaca]
MALSSSFTLSPCTPADIDAVAAVYHASFASDRANTFWWPRDPGAMLAWTIQRVRRKMRDPTVRHFKVVDGGELVAFARWDVPVGHEDMFGAWDGEGVGGGYDEEGKKEEERGDGNRDRDRGIEVGEVGDADPLVDDAAASAPVPYPEGARPDLCRLFFDALAGASKQWHEETMLGLSLLCTSPKYHRRGAAKALLLPMLALADARGLRVYLEATPGGKPVYEKLGFQVVDELRFDLDKLTTDFEGEYKLSIMIREPKAI